MDRNGIKWQAHHVIPEQMWKIHISGVPLSIGMDDKFNGIPLPSNFRDAYKVGLPAHFSSHSYYSGLMDNPLRQYRRQYERDIRSKDSKTRCKAAAMFEEKIKALAGTYQGIFRNGQAGLSGKLQ